MLETRKHGYLHPKLVFRLLPFFIYPPSIDINQLTGPQELSLALVFLSGVLKAFGPESDGVSIDYMVVALHSGKRSSSFWGYWIHSILVKSRCYGEVCGSLIVPSFSRLWKLFGQSNYMLFGHQKVGCSDRIFEWSNCETHQRLK
ncbi:hypothetical protein Tco_0716601, partial [Tanacetum coccineum]